MSGLGAALRLLAAAVDGFAAPQGGAGQRATFA